LANFNQEDPAKQEAIRRKSHEYVEGGGRHGVYKEKPYIHQEYPKVMDKTPAPKRVDFKGKEQIDLLLENATREWDELQKASIVNNAAEEERWLEEHANDRVVSITDRMYPKTMDKTPAPLPAAFDSLDDFRAAREEHKKRIQASIVHDRDEEELWLRENQPQTAKRKSKKAS
jgi:hypothetical protein